MPDPDDDFEARLAVLEREVARLREQTALTSFEATAARVDAAAARVLAAGADHDVSEVRAELRAHLQALNAVRETQLDQAREMHEGFAQTREGFAKQATGMAHITALLTKIADPDGLNQGVAAARHPAGAVARAAKRCLTTVPTIPSTAVSPATCHGAR